MRKYNSQSGNALFLILIGTMLFAALSFAVGQMLRGGEGRQLQESEVRGLESSEMMQFARALRSAVQAMQIDGIGESQISFRGQDEIAGYNNTACTVDACNLFLKSGGGLSYIPPEPAWRDGTHTADPWLFTGANAVAGVGTAATDLLVILPYVKKTTCLRVNGLLSITNPAGDAPQITGTPDLTTQFTGSYAGTGSISGAAEINGARSGCFRGSGTPPVDSYHYYQVLIAR